MTATGLVRRIDDLGRFVVPKELRRKLRWHSGAQVEVFTAPDGIICLKKFSSMGEDRALAQKMADSMAQASKCIVCVSDMDRIIAAAGGAKSQLMDKDISRELESAISARKLLISKRMSIVVSLETNNAYPYAVVAPIVSGGDTEGAVVMLSKDTEMGDNEAMLARTAALLLGEWLAA